LKPNTPYNLLLNKMDISNSYITLQFKYNNTENNLPITKFILHKEYNSESENQLEFSISDITYDYYGNYLITDSDISTYKISDIIIYKVKAVNDIGESEYSNTIKVILSSLPNAPSNLLIKNRINKTSLTLKWDIEEEIENNIETKGYAIYLNSNLFIDTSTTVINNEYTLNNLTPGKKYNVYIKSINDLGESEESTDTLTFYAGTIPGNVTNVKKDEKNSDKNNIKINFDSPNDNGGNSITKYIIYDNDNNNNVIDTINTEDLTSELSYTFSDLESGSEKNIIIKATNIIGENNDENVYNFIAATIPDKPSNL